jgi:signal transduction histidine kinase
MRNLMMDLLDLAQMENNQFKLNKTFFSLYDALMQAKSIVRFFADAKRLRLESPVMMDAKFTQVYGDRHRFE